MMLPEELGREIVARTEDKIKRISAQGLVDLGFRINPKGVFIAIGNKEKEYGIFQVVDEKKHPTSFSFCYSGTEKTGVILTHPFTDYSKFLSS